MSKRLLRKELEELKSSCQDSSYWNTPPKRRSYLVEYEEKEDYYDNMVLKSLKEYDDICEYKVGKKVCFQKHCSHKEVKEERQMEEENQEEIQLNPLNLLIEALEMMNTKRNEEERQEDIGLIKLVPYSDSEEDDNSYDTDDSMTEYEEIINGQAPMYLLPEGFK